MYYTPTLMTLHKKYEKTHTKSVKIKKKGNIQKRVDPGCPKSHNGSYHPFVTQCAREGSSTLHIISP